MGQTCLKTWGILSLHNAHHWLLTSNPNNLFLGCSLSKELLSLVERSRRFNPPTDEPPEPSEDLQRLWGRVETRRWKERSLLRLQLLLRELDGELWVIEHVLGCHDCQMEWQLAVERYMGTRCPWYLNLCNDVGPIYPGCPKIEDYEFGSYWTRDEGKALPFVIARLKWAEDIISREFAASSTLINILEHWDIEQGISGKSLTAMLDEIAGIEPDFSVPYP